MISAQQLADCTGAPLVRSAKWLDVLVLAMGTFAIDTPARMAPFLANLGHESGRLFYTREIWGPTDTQLRYEGRKDLGNLRPGDGRKYLGRGLMQTTGHANYVRLRDSLRLHLTGVPDFEISPDLVELPKWAAYSACLFWHDNRLNALADASPVDFDGICDRINRGRKTAPIGDSNGWAERLAFYNAGKKALGVTA